MTLQQMPAFRQYCVRRSGVHVAGDAQEGGETLFNLLYGASDCAVVAQSHEVASHQKQVSLRQFIDGAGGAVDVSYENDPHFSVH